MSWNAYICNTMDGRIGPPIDLGSFDWEVDVSDASLSTNREKGVGETTVSSLSIPWSSVPGDTMSEKRRMLCPDRSSVALMWRDRSDPPDSVGRPLLWGAVGVRSDTMLSTSFSLNSALTMLADRHIVREGRYGTGPNGTSPDIIDLKNLSLRAIASEVGYLATACKPGGMLPIDWTYRGERGAHERQYDAWDVQNLDAKSVLGKISNVLGGPDMQFRPYMTSDGQHVRLKFVAGSDADIYLGAGVSHFLSYGPDGGNVDALTVDHLGAVHRVYASGSGQDKTQITVMVEDLRMIQGFDPWPLREATYSDSDTANRGLLTQHAKSYLAANASPLMQITCTVDADDHDEQDNPVFPLGSCWPGEKFTIAIDGFPPLPDGEYHTRLMRMSGNKTSQIKLVFDVMVDPTT